MSRVSGSGFIVGLDLAEHLGWAVLRRGTGAVVAAGAVHLGRLDPGERLLRLRDHVRELFARFAPVTTLVLEDVFLPQRTSRRTPIALGELRGVARLGAAESGVPVAFYPPARVKSAITGSGRAGKADMVRWINRECGWTATDHNEADAIALAYTHHLLGRASIAVGAARDLAGRPVVGGIAANWAGVLAAADPLSGGGDGGNAGRTAARRSTAGGRAGRACPGGPR